MSSIKIWRPGLIEEVSALEIFSGQIDGGTETITRETPGNWQQIVFTSYGTRGIAKGERLHDYLIRSVLDIDEYEKFTQITDAENSTPDEVMYDSSVLPVSVAAIASVGNRAQSGDLLGANSLLSCGYRARGLIAIPRASHLSIAGRLIKQGYSGRGFFVEFNLLELIA